MLTAVDLFSGAGGISLGLTRAGYKVLLASDVHPEYSTTHASNMPSTLFEVGDIRDWPDNWLLDRTGLLSGELDLLVGGPPCQGFSIIGSRVNHDPRNDLFREMFRLARAARPKALVIENVPGLTTLAKGAYLSHILEGYAELGYDVDYAELLAAQYGTPQMRRRMVFVGFRKDLGLQAGLGFPAPRRGRRGIGELPANLTVPPADEADFVNTREALGDLPPVAAGECVSTYVGPPSTEYQRQMRAGLRSELFNHYAAGLSPVNLARLRALAPGQDWRDLPKELLPPSMQRALRKDHTRRYRRMTWEGIPRSVITRFRDPKTGEYTHPSQDRTLTIREAARLQGFPDSFIFSGTRTSQYEQVGNAVPVQLAQAIGEEVAAALAQTATFVLPKSAKRYLRIPDTAAQCLPFDLLDQVSS
ncbi:DNA cytosine methyltransferase [Micromonospora sp. C28ISP2-4]|uniref:DNA cytosine methyltransferase n=1 Tax=Micromonospora sp. C28ISP2-4 TaxID=3059523 RepID=UPI002674A799|nr:DNA cytosine methyltransferase [Micromonospora sp. C28ISP2-4]MDO3687366.1 DNA cytosine methyltransferase [Micromonospora sp. C28ISP2-4]